MKISRAALALTAFALGGATAEVIDWLVTPTTTTQPAPSQPPVATTYTGTVRFFPRSSDSSAPSFYTVGKNLICQDVILDTNVYYLDDRVYLASYIKKDADVVGDTTFAPTCTLSSAYHGILQ